MQTIEDKWDEIKENIRKEYDLSDVSFHTWVEPLRFFDVQDDVVTILIPSDQSHALNYISSKYKGFPSRSHRRMDWGSTAAISPSLISA